MIGNKELFSNFEEKDLQMLIEMGDDGRYSANNIGIVTFQMDSSSPLTLRDVMYVLGLKKNLVSSSMSEDRGYHVIFNKGKGIPLPQSHNTGEADRGSSEEPLQIGGRRLHWFEH